MSVFPSVADQDRAIRSSWPSFRLVERSERAATWLGTLKPFMLAYEVRVSYQVPLVIERIAPCGSSPRSG